MFKNSEPCTPNDALSVVRALEHTNGPLVFSMSANKVDPEWTFVIGKLGEEDSDYFHPVTELLKVDLNHAVRRALVQNGWDMMRVDVCFPASLRPSMAKLGITGPPGDCLIISFETTEIRMTPH